MIEQPFPYQVEGAKWLATKTQALLADSMGLGKSAQTIIACDIVGASRVLIVCPAAVRINWDREFTRFSPMDRHNTVIMTGKDEPGPQVNVVSFDLLASNEKLRNKLKSIHWDVVIIDEAHYLKERTAKRTKALYGHAQHPGICHNAKRVWRLTGTPAPNNVSELWTHLKSGGVVNEPYWDFVYRFCSGFDADYGYKITGHKNVEQLRALLSTFMLRRKKEDVLKDLPDIIFQNVTVERSEVELDPWFYENWRPIGVPQFLANLKTLDTNLKNALDSIKDCSHYAQKDAITLLESFTKSTSTLRRYIGLAKLPKILDIIEDELKSGQVKKIVLFAVHQQVIENARVRLREYGAVTLFGGTPAARRQSNIDRFMKDDTCRVFIGQITAAGTGITLTSAHEVAFLESDWVPANNAQAAMRVHRIGQTRKVRCRFFNCAGSVDEQISSILMHKSRELAKVFY